MNVFKMVLSSAFVVALLPRGLPLFISGVLKVLAASEMDCKVGRLLFFFLTSLRMSFNLTGFEPFGGLRKAKIIARVLSSICAEDMIPKKRIKRGKE